ncbi:MAG TPA: MFS transporter [Rhodocyclaceae bacterium]|nr:MFS transporter [Rhodocyclaceae bacterium]
MSSMQNTHSLALSVTEPAKAEKGGQAAKGELSPGLVLLLAAAAGLAVATIYYVQPMLGILGADLHAGTREVGLVPTAAQIGYALGILLLAPLGDRYDRRRIILIKAGGLTVALLLAGAAPNIALLITASLAIGLAATLVQDIVPAAATLAPDHSRGKIVGTVMTGVLMGILLSRVLSGFMAEAFGWRAVFMAAAVSIAAIAVALWRKLPRFAPTTQQPYLALLASLLDLLKKYSPLRRAALAQGLMSAGFGAFWCTLALMLHEAPFHMGSAVAGSFGLAGAAGALIAPIAGKLADKKGPSLVTRIGTAFTAASFAVMALAPALSTQGQLWLLALCTVGFDLGVQATLIAHQTIVYGLEPAARSRLNAVLFVGMFIGMSAGAALASLLFAQWGWLAVVALATSTSLLAFVVRMLPAKT